MDVTSSVPSNTIVRYNNFDIRTQPRKFEFKIETIIFFLSSLKESKVNGWVLRSSTGKRLINNFGLCIYSKANKMAGYLYQVSRQLSVVSWKTQLPFFQLSDRLSLTKSIQTTQV